MESESKILKISIIKAVLRNGEENPLKYFPFPMVIMVSPANKELFKEFSYPCTLEHPKLGGVRVAPY